jgi:hypothetical protein
MIAQFSRVLTLIVSIACLFFGQQAPPESSPTYHSETELVLVPFNVVRGLYFAPDVRADDVLLLEDGKPRSFSAFEGPGTGRRPPLELVLLFDTTTLPPPESKIKVMGNHWDRKATYDFTNHWDDTMSRALLEKESADIRVSVYHYDHQQMQRLCRSTSDPQTLTSAIHRLPEPIPADEAIPLTLPPNRMTHEAWAVKQSGPTLATGPLMWPVSWTMEAMIEALRDSSAAPENAVRVLAVFSEGWGFRSDLDPPWYQGDARSPTTTTPQDAADQANALGIAVYPVVLDFEVYAHQPFPSLAPYHTDNVPAIRMAVFGSVGELTGGRAFYPSRMDPAAVSDILDVIRNQGLSQYLVGFAPASSAHRRKHNLEIRLKSKSAGKLMGGMRTAVY